MTGLLLFLSQTAASCMRTTVGLFLAFRLLSVKKPKKRRIAAAVCTGILLALLQSLTGWQKSCGMAFEAVFLAALVARRKQEQRMSLFFGIFYVIAVGFWQFLFAAYAGMLLGMPQFLDEQTGYGQLARWSFLAVLGAFTCYLYRHPDFAGKRAFRLASFLVLVGFLAVVTLSEQTSVAIAEDELELWTIFSAVLLVAVLVFNMNRQYEVEKELAELKSQQASLLEHDYRALSDAYALNAKLFHDFHNHIGVLRQLLLKDKKIEAVQYLDELQAPVQNMADTVWTGDGTVDYLINSKMAAARKDDIALRSEVEFPRHTNLRSADLCAILGNLLDNALEAAKQVKKEERQITLTMRRVNQMMVIKVENPFIEAPVEENGALKTTKLEGLHGWGLKSVQTAAEKYDGLLQATYEDGRFRAVVTLSFYGVAFEDNQKE